MSGHSKWATIKRQKGVNDAKRGQIFTKLANAITIAVREGGGVIDPNSNFKLRLQIDKARAANMPKENIERAIERATGASAANLTEAQYEGFSPGGGAVIVQTVSDNKMRTVAEIKNLFEKNGGTFANTGAVSYLFSQKGELIIDKNGKSIDAILSSVLVDGVEDIIDANDTVICYTAPTDLFAAKQTIEAAGFTVKSAEIVYQPMSTVSLSDQTLEEKVISFLEKLEDNDDVQKVFTNIDFTSAS